MTPDDITLTNPAANATRDQSDAALDAGLAAAFGGDTTHLRPPTAEPEAGTVIAGKYRLTEKVGEGGMGSVWVANQTEPVKRKVAVKLIKAGMDSKAVLARFDAERQALAVMDHPNIAKVLDGGVTADGRPYFVMELVKGVPITQFCDERKLTPQQRLELFVPVCEAIQHAHQKGVIHRDIKPSNVLVALYDDKAVPKVIDFGIAKATGAALTEHTLDTGIGAVVGTPAYMSPEQASLNNLDIDTRSDVYALGVLLYELLTGSPPFSGAELQRKGVLEMLRVVREEEPPRPSHKLSTADALPSLSANRGTEPKKLTGLLRSELDWIVMKALEKDRGRRYETANGFAADVLRFLTGEPVQAHPPSAGYRLKKFVRRNRGQVVAGALVLLALLAGMASTSVGLVVANERRKEADQARQDEAEQRAVAVAEKKKAEEAEMQTLEDYRESTADALEKLIGSKAVLGPQERAYLENMLRRWQAYANRLGDDTRSRGIRSEGHFRIAELSLKLGELEAAKRDFEAAREIQVALVAAHPAVPMLRHMLAYTHLRYADLLREQGAWSEAKREFLAARTLFQQLVEEAHPHETSYQSELASSHNNLGILLRDLGELAAARREYEAARDIYRALSAAHPDAPKFRQPLALAHNNLGQLFTAAGDKKEAQQEYEAARDIQKRLCADHPTDPSYPQDLATTLNNLGIVLGELGDLNGGIRETRAAIDLRKQLSDAYPAVPGYQDELASAVNNLGVILIRNKDHTGAKRELEAARTIQQKLVAKYPAVPSYQLRLARTHINVGSVLAREHERGEAKQEYEVARGILRRLIDAHPQVPEYQQELANVHDNLAALALDRGDADTARREYEAARDLRTKLAASATDPVELLDKLVSCHRKLTSLHQKAGDVGAARREHEAAGIALKKLIAARPDKPAYSRRLADGHNQFGYWLGGVGELEAAKRENEAAREVLQKLIADNPNVYEYQIDLGGCYCNLGLILRPSAGAAETLKWFDLAIKTLAAVHAKDPQNAQAKQYLRNCHANRASSHAELDRFADAVADWDRTIELSPKTEHLRYRLVRVTARAKTGQLADALAEVDEWVKAPVWPAPAWYDFARVYAIAAAKLPDRNREYADRAMEFLTKAVKAGYKDPAHMKTDTDLDSLRERDDFKKLLADLEAKFPPRKETPPPEPKK